jgi:hypothetical protein
VYEYSDNSIKALVKYSRNKSKQHKKIEVSGEASIEASIEAVEIRMPYTSEQKEILR